MLKHEIYEKLCSYCAYQERCAADVKLKLHKLNVEKVDYGKYIQKLQDENFLNEERYVKSFIASHAKKKWGKTKMKNALLQKRLDSSLVKKYLDNIDDEDYASQIKTLAEKKLRLIKAGTINERKVKLIRHLLSKGFEMQKINTVLKELKL